MKRTKREDDEALPRILIVDDEDKICRLYAEGFRDEGYNVITTTDGGGLFEIIEQQKPEVIVLDIKVGIYDGLDLLQDIRNAHYSLPVILCSAYSSFKYDLKSVAADYYVVKSTDFSELKNKIHMALETASSKTTRHSKANRKPAHHLSFMAE